MALRETPRDVRTRGGEGADGPGIGGGGLAGLGARVHPLADSRDPKVGDRAEEEPVRLGALDRFVTVSSGRIRGTMSLESGQSPSILQVA